LKLVLYGFNSPENELQVLPHGIERAYVRLEVFQSKCLESVARNLIAFRQVSVRLIEPLNPAIV
jgi:hypothetical protein